METRLILASASPQRKQLLTNLGVDFQIEISNITELIYDSPKETALINAYMKGKDVKQKNPQHIVLSADTVVEYNGIPFGKPRNDDDAFRMLQALSGNWHEVHTGLALFSGENVKKEVVTTKVHFVTLSEKQIWQYIQTKEPNNKAGAYGIQGRASAFVDRLEGCYTNVFGMPMASVRKLLLDIGFEL